MLVDNSFLDQPLMLETEALTMDSLANSWLDFGMNERNFETFEDETDEEKEEVAEEIDWMEFF